MPSSVTLVDRLMVVTVTKTKNHHHHPLTSIFNITRFRSSTMAIIQTLVIVIAALLCSIIFTIPTASAAAASSSTPVQCIDDNGKPVDWYFVYKFPYIPSKPRVLFGGYSYAYITSNNATAGWHLSPSQITDVKKSIFARTLSPVYASDHGLSSLFYNDQPPGDDNIPSSYAHSKGLLVANNSTGFWLIHTVPHFAPANGSYNYVASGGRYGQVALCISFNTTELTKVVEHNFLTDRPYVYGYTNPHSDTTALGKALKRVKDAQWNTTISYADNTFISLAGVPFRSFYKSPNDEVDLYAGIIAPAIQSPLLVETWRKNPGTPLNSTCNNNKLKVENIKNIQLQFVNSQEKGKFFYLDDHSKWAITNTLSSPSSKKLACVGDINRVHSQFQRGGGTTCIEMNYVWQGFRDFIDDIEPCNKSECYDCKQQS